MNIPGNGTFEFEELVRINGPGSKITAKLVEKLTRNMVINSAKCMKMLEGEHPLALYERSMYSVLAAAAAAITPAHLSETPVKRVKRCLRGKDKKVRKRAGEELGQPGGRVDLYCHWRKTDFLVELKQSYTGLREDTLSAKLCSSWHGLNTQIESVQSVVTDWFDQAATIGILCVCPWSRAQTAREIDNWSCDIDRIRKGLVGLKPSASFLATWNLGRSQWVQEWSGNEGQIVNEVIPAIFLVGLIKMRASS